MAAGITSQFDRCPETKTTGTFVGGDLEQALLVDHLDPAGGRQDPSISGNSAKVRPRLSHWAVSMAARQASSLSGKASLRLRVATLCALLTGPTVRPSQPPNAEAASTPSRRMTPTKRSKPSASARHRRSWAQGRRLSDMNP
jgi:hypothetical protein